MRDDGWDAAWMMVKMMMLLLMVRRRRLSMSAVCEADYKHSQSFYSVCICCAPRWAKELRRERQTRIVTAKQQRCALFSATVREKNFAAAVSV